MRKAIGLMFGVLVLFVGCQKSDYKEVQQYTIEQFMNTTTIFGSAFSADEQNILFSSNQSGVFNAYTVPVAGGEVTQLTHSDGDAVFAISFFPNDGRILFRGDKGGNEIWHIYLRNEDGSISDLTPDENARAVFYGWNRDKKSFYFGSNKLNPKFMDVYEMNVETFDAELIYQNQQGLNFSDISNDRNYIAFSKTITTNNSEMYLYDTRSRELKNLIPHDEDISLNPLGFSNDSGSLLFLTDENDEFQYLMKFQLESGESELVEKADWDIMYGALSYNEKFRVVGINNDARTEIKIVNTETGYPVRIDNLPDGDLTSVNISESEKLMTFYLSGSRFPRNLYVFDFETGESRKLTDSLNPEIKGDDLVDATVIRYKSFDDLEIPAILYKPHQIKPGEKAPALVWVHGGPGGQSRIGYVDVIQYLVNHGYVVLAVNNRGSSGYGKAFFALDDQKHGEDDLLDCVKAKDFLTATGYVDENKIGIIGGSYGGYMVLAALTYQPQAFDVGVDIFGVANWVRTLQSIPPWWEAFRLALYKEMGNPETDLEYLKRISPLFHAENIVKPLIVLQGANDPRVLKVESDEIVEAVRKNEVPVEYVVFDDEGHGFRKNENKVRGYKAILEFLNEHLKGQDGAPAMSSKSE